MGVLIDTQTWSITETLEWRGKQITSVGLGRARTTDGEEMKEEMKKRKTEIITRLSSLVTYCDGRLITL